MSKYKNDAKAKQEDEELEALETAYREQNDPGFQPEAIEEEAAPTLTSEEETWKSRYSNLRSHSDQVRNDLSKQLKELETQVKLLQSKPVELPSNLSIEDAREWTKKYPDLAATLKTLWKEDIEFLKEEIGPSLTELQGMKEEIARERAFATVLRAHPDFQDLINSAEFQEWVDRQPEEKGVIGETIFNALRKSYEPDPAIRAINIYKQELNFTKQPKKNSARESVQVVTKPSSGSPRSDGKRQFSESQIESMSIRDYERLESEIELAKRENRITYDISGAAR